MIFVRIDRWTEDFTLDFAPACILYFECKWRCILRDWDHSYSFLNMAALFVCTWRSECLLNVQ